MMHSYLHDSIIKSLVIKRLEGRKKTSDSEFEEEKIKTLSRVWFKVSLSFDNLPLDAATWAPT
jgi:hypothetical protein